MAIQYFYEWVPLREQSGKGGKLKLIPASKKKKWKNGRKKGKGGTLGKNIEEIKERIRNSPQGGSIETKGKSRGRASPGSECSPT